MPIPTCSRPVKAKAFGCSGSSVRELYETTAAPTPTPTPTPAAAPTAIVVLSG